MSSSLPNNVVAPPLILLLGCTAVGKTDVAMHLARHIGAEIVCVDSMQVYRRMDVGTAKPTAVQRAAVPHHMLDLVEPSESFAASKFVEQADAAIAEIHSRGRVALAVAGTPFYLMALTYGLFDGPSADEPFRAHIRARAAKEGIAVLHGELARVDAEAAARIHENDLKRIERALEVHHHTGRPISELQGQWNGPPRYALRGVGLRREREELSRRISLRVRNMIAEGLVDEVGALLAEPKEMSEQARVALGYAETIAHLRGEMGLDDAVERIKINTRRFAKSQRTWFRKFQQVSWMDLRADEGAEETAERAAGILVS